MKHLKENNETYLSHLKFALLLSIGFFSRSIVFLVHSIFPFVPIPKMLNVEKTLKWIKTIKEYTDNRISEKK
tara:strand:+ start:881 stop:1096 length:216 start_codon:yes stop_codon:yes gene_type:complete